MYWWFSTDECAREVADKLIHGETVAYAWIDGVSDWFLDNHPIVIAVETKAIFSNGDILWSVKHVIHRPSLIFVWDAVADNLLESI